MTSYRCPSCGGEWEADYCPECGTTIPTARKPEGFGYEGHDDPRLDLPLAGPDSRPASVREMSAVTFVTWFVGSVVLAGILIGLGFILVEERLPEAAIALFVIGGLIAVVVPVVVVANFIHRIWSSIQDGYAPTTPGRAVGLCFVPFFNFYWIFRVFPGFPTAYNAYIRRHGISVRPLSGGIYVAYAVFCLLGVIPVVNWFTAPVALIVAGFVLADGCRAVNALVDAPMDGRGFDRGQDGPVGFDPAAGHDRPRESNTILGVFVLILGGESLFWWSLRWLEVSFHGFRYLFMGADVLFSCVPLVMAFFVRNLGLKIAAILVSLIPIIRMVLRIIEMYRF